MRPRQESNIIRVFDNRIQPLPSQPMPKYSTLSEMGIQNPQQIDRYSVQTIHANTDILRIVYKRKKGSLLPTSKRFRFPRTEKVMPGNSDSEQSQIYYEISPVVHKAMVELDSIVRSKRDRAQQLAVINDEVQRLQDETISRIEYIKSLIAKM